MGLTRKKHLASFKGLHHRRTQDDYHQAERERAFAEEWLDEGKRWDPWSGDALQKLMVVAKDASKPVGEAFPFFSTNRRFAFVPGYTERVIVSTVIQWLGSNVGWCFLERALRRCGYRVVKINEG